MKPITYIEARILKAAGERINVKVTVAITPNRRPVVYMRDFAFDTFTKAARYLRHVTETELAPLAEVRS